MKELGLSGLIARFKPLHIGGATMLEHTCKNSDYVKIGLGSSNRYNLRNPFTIEETIDMVDLFLSDKHIDNYEIIKVPDFSYEDNVSGEDRWTEYVKEEFGSLDYFVSGNTYVGELLENEYKIIHPSEVIPRESWVKARATQVRIDMSLGDSYKKSVPDVVSDYLEKNGIVDRFRSEFGLETLALLDKNDYLAEDPNTERDHVMKYEIGARVWGNKNVSYGKL